MQMTQDAQSHSRAYHLAQMPRQSCTDEGAGVGLSRMMAQLPDDPAAQVVRAWARGRIDEWTSGRMPSGKHTP